MTSTVGICLILVFLEGVPPFRLVLWFPSHQTSSNYSGIPVLQNPILVDTHVLPRSLVRHEVEVCLAIFHPYA